MMNGVIDVDTARIIDCDWTKLTLGERIRSIEVEGYVVIPDLLTPDHIAHLKEITATFQTTPTDYSSHQRGRSEIQFDGGLITDLIAHGPTIAFLRALFGDEIIMMHYGYARSEPGHPGISLHTDGQPWGAKIFGDFGTPPFMVRVLYYLDDLTTDVSPFRVIPRSHLSMHADANPYARFESHPEERMVLAKAGSAVMINHRVFHGNFPNVGDRSREMLAIAYRPAWAGPLAQEIPAWDLDEVANLPDHVRSLFGDRNTRHWDYHHDNKPPDMKSEAPGINPSRWEQE